MADDGGISRVRKRLAAIPKNIIREIQPALRRSAEEMVAGMKALAEPHRKTGALIESIVITEAGKATPPYSQPGGSITVPDNAIAITVGNTEVRYGHLLEYGHSKGFHGSPVPPHPFFWPVVRSHRKRAANRIKRAARKGVRKEWGK